MENKYKELFDKISPRMSDEELLSAVLDRKAVKNMRKKFNKKAVLIPAVALAVFGATTVGVSAAFNWNLSSAIQALFQKPEVDGEHGMAFKDFVIDDIGSKELTDGFERDGYTVQLIGVIADEHTSFLMYDLTIDEERVFEIKYPDCTYDYTCSNIDEAYLDIKTTYESYSSMLDEYLENKRLIDENYEESDFTKLLSHETPQVIGREGNVFHCAQRYDVSMLSLKDKEITFDVSGITLRFDDSRLFGESDNAQVLDKLTIKYDFINESPEISLTPNAPFRLGDGEYSIGSVNLSFLSVDIRVDWGRLTEEDETYKNIGTLLETARKSVGVRFKDGSVTDNGALFWKDGYNIGVGEEGFRTSVLHLMWRYPVDINDIEAIIIGDTEIKVN